MTFLLNKYNAKFYFLASAILILIFYRLYPITQGGLASLDDIGYYFDAGSNIYFAKNQGRIQLLLAMYVTTFFYKFFGLEITMWLSMFFHFLSLILFSFLISKILKNNILAFFIVLITLQFVEFSGIFNYFMSYSTFYSLSLIFLLLSSIILHYKWYSLLLYPLYFVFFMLGLNLTNEHTFLYIPFVCLNSYSSISNTKKNKFIKCSLVLLPALIQIILYATWRYYNPSNVRHNVAELQNIQLIVKSLLGFIFGNIPIVRLIVENTNFSIQNFLEYFFNIPELLMSVLFFISLVISLKFSIKKLNKSLFNFIIITCVGMYLTIAPSLLLSLSNKWKYLEARDGSLTYAFCWQSCFGLTILLVLAVYSYIMRLKRKKQRMFSIYLISFIFSCNFMLSSYTNSSVTTEAIKNISYFKILNRFINGPMFQLVVDHQTILTTQPRAFTCSGKGRDYFYNKFFKIYAQKKISLTFFSDFEKKLADIYFLPFYVDKENNVSGYISFLPTTNNGGYLEFFSNLNEPILFKDIYVESLNSSFEIVRKSNYSIPYRCSTCIEHKSIVSYLTPLHIKIPPGYSHYYASNLLIN